ncbi:hypothetical protein ACHAQH_006645 [Verticillium albo-atrum]
MFFTSTVLRTLLPLALLSKTNASPTQNAKIQWGECGEDVQNITIATGGLPLQCATLQVPHDYRSPNTTEKLSLELARVPAAVQPSKGSIQFNFGGPGIPSRTSLAAAASIYMNFTGGQYDLVAFDPRATGTTNFSCFADPAALIEYNLKAGLASTASDVAEGQLWAAGTAYSNACLETQAKNASLVNAPFFARDLISVVDALDEDGMLRFWVAATVSFMFPERIDKMVFDGVQNPHEYYYALGDFEEWTNTDEVFSAIFSKCKDFPENCALSKYNMTGAELEQEAWDFLETVRYQPLVLGTTTIDYSTLKGVIAQNLYNTELWPTFSVFWDLLMTRENDTLALQTAAEKNWLGFLGEGAEPLSQIRCGDRVARASSLEEFKPTIDRLTNTSRIYGDLVVSLNAACAQWQVGAAERLESDFHVKTENPVLFVGNTWDGHTPLVSAKNVSSTFEGSGLLEIHGYGATATMYFAAVAAILLALRPLATYAKPNGIITHPTPNSKLDLSSEDRSMDIKWTYEGDTKKWEAVDLVLQGESRDNAGSSAAWSASVAIDINMEARDLKYNLTKGYSILDKMLLRHLDASSWVVRFGIRYYTWDVDGGVLEDVFFSEPITVEEEPCNGSKL